MVIDMYVVCPSCGYRWESIEGCNDFNYNGDDCHCYYTCPYCKNIHRKRIPKGQIFRPGESPYYIKI